MSLPINFGSASSAQSVLGDAFASYRRAQYLVAGSALCAASDTSETLGDDDEESNISPIQEDYIDEFEENDRTPSRDDFIGEFNWDGLEPETSTIRPADVQTELSLPVPSPVRPIISPASSLGVSSPVTPSGVNEHTPLLRKALSFSNAPHPRRVPAHAPEAQVPGIALSDGSTPTPLLRRRSSASGKSIRVQYRGQSTFGQTLFNSIAILLGIGMLSEPLAFAYAGWVAGTLLIISYGFIACYTAKILARIIVADPRLRSYADIGRKAFGHRSTIPISLLFCLELFAVSVILVTLYADSLHTILPQYSSDTYKLWGLLLLIPTVFLPLSLLSYASILGILSIVLLVAVILIDGFSKKDAPGSLWSPAETYIGVGSISHLGLAFGLFMAGFSGHAVIPSLARDMADPSQFDKMIDCAFLIATLIYTLIGYAGYLMFGEHVSDEISVDLLNTPGYNPILNQAALWMLVISPLTKFALTTQPLNATIEILLGLDTPLAAPEHLSGKPSGLSVSPHGSHIGLKRMLGVAQRIFFTVLSVGVSILVPEFGSMMAFLGSFSAFIICIIGPIGAKIAIEKRCSFFDGLALAIGIVMAVWGTVVAFL